MVWCQTTAMAYKIPLLEGTKLQIPYSFYSEYVSLSISMRVYLTICPDSR